MIEQINQLFEQLAETPLFQELGVIAVFLYAITPAIVFIPSEVFIAPLVASGISPFTIIAFGGLGGFVGDLLLYYLGRHGSGFIRNYFKKHKKAEARAEHWMHKYKHVVFLTTAFTSFIGDFIMILAGHERIHLSKIWYLLIIGNVARNAVGMIVILGMFNIPNCLGSLCF